MSLRRIRELHPEPHSRLRIVWDDGARGTIDLSSLVRQGGVFAPLADDSLFRQVRIGERRRTIEWTVPGVEHVVDIDADALYERAVRNYELMPTP